MSHWSVGQCDSAHLGVNALEWGCRTEHVWVKIFKDTVEKVILKTRNFWKFESATNEQTNKQTNEQTEFGL